MPDIRKDAHSGAILFVPTESELKMKKLEEEIESLKQLVMSQNSNKNRR